MASKRPALFDQLNSSQWTGFIKGVEKEGLRVDRNGFIAQTPHPLALGSALTHPQITTDYSEALLELITPACHSTADLLTSLRDIHTFTQLHLGDEVMWAASMPCRIDGEASIPIAEYGSANIARLKHVYRQGLGVRYGRIMQSIAGLHYNFSLPDSFWPLWQTALGDLQSLQAFKSAEYFHLIRNFRRRSWLLMTLFGASPALDASFVAGRSHTLTPWGEQSFHGPYATSLRMGDLGYHNHAQASLAVCFNHLDSYIETLDQAIHTHWPAYDAIGLQRNGIPIQINTNVLQIENEYYSPIRPKRTVSSEERPIEALRARGIEYIEVRCLDLNPFDALGLNAAQIDFLDVFLLSCLIDDSPALDQAGCAEVEHNFRQAVAQGRNPACMLHTDGNSQSLVASSLSLFESFQAAASTLDRLSGGDSYQTAVALQAKKLQDPACMPSAQVLDAMRQQQASHLEWTLQQSLDHQATLRAAALPPATLAHMRREAAESLAQQTALEAADRESFEDYLVRFRNHS